MVAEVKGDTMAAKRPFRDSDYYKISIALEDGKPAFEHVPTEMVRAAVEVAAEQNVFDSAQEWLTSLRWDGKPRVRSFLHAYFGSEDTPYNTAVSLYWWSGQAGRVMQPGIKADMAPIAVGSQGTGKTSAVMAMAPTPSHFLELDLTKSDDDLAREMRGRLVVEIGEMKGSNTRQVEHTKSFLSRTTEKWVPKYKEFTTEYPGGACSSVRRTATNPCRTTTPGTAAGFLSPWSTTAAANPMPSRATATSCGLKPWCCSTNTGSCGRTRRS